MAGLEPAIQNDGCRSPKLAAFATRAPRPSSGRSSLSQVHWTCSRACAPLLTPPDHFARSAVAAQGALSSWATESRRQN